MRVTPEEVRLLLTEGAKLAPSLANTRILRGYAGVRPLVSADNDPSGRNISRGIVCLDHETRDGLKGFVTITGGKLMTYRLMAEIATDTVCRKLAVDVPCVTAKKPLPGSEGGGLEEVHRHHGELGTSTTLQEQHFIVITYAHQFADVSLTRVDNLLKVGISVAFFHNAIANAVIVHELFLRL